MKLRAILIIAVLAALQCDLHAQPGPNFITVSIKPNSDPPNISGAHKITPGRVHFVHVALKTLILDAFRIKAYQLISPVNLVAGRWDVEATMAPDSSPEQVASMLRTMLQDRFGLQTHSESRLISAYVLTSVAANKLQPTTDPTGQLSLDS